MSGMEDRMNQGDVSPELLTEYAEIQKKLENQMSVWELAQMNLDNLKNG